MYKADALLSFVAEGCYEVPIAMYGAAIISGTAHYTNLVEAASTSYGYGTLLTFTASLDQMTTEAFPIGDLTTYKDVFYETTCAD